MEDVEPERRIGRRKRKLSARQGVVIGVATVAGLGLMSKLVSFLRREKPKKLKDGDIETLEAVLSGDAAKVALPPQTEVHMFANLEDDEPNHEVVNSHEGSPPSSKDADSFSEVTQKDDVTEDGEMHVSQDLVGAGRYGADANTLTAEESEQSPISHDEGNTKEVSHSNGEVEEKHRNGDVVELHTEDEGKQLNGDAVTELQIEEKDAEKLPSEDAVELQSVDEVKLHIEDEGEQHNEDAEKLPSEDAVELQGVDDVKPHIEDVVELLTEDEGKHHNEDVVEVNLIEDKEKILTKDEEKHHNEDPVELQNESEGKLHIEDAEKPHSENAVELLFEDAKMLDTEDEGKQSSEDSVELHT